MVKARKNHYVPEWYQKGFLVGGKNQLHYLDLHPEEKLLFDGRRIRMNSKSIRPTSNCFFQTDLYTTFFGGIINDEIENKLFGKIDDSGARAVRAFIAGDLAEQHNHFRSFFTYIDSQKLRTPKGLDWIRVRYPSLNQVELMVEMQAIRNLHCTLWTEGVREIVSAEQSDTKFLLTDHPVTVFNRSYAPGCAECQYPNDPPINLKGSITLFPLDLEHCLILTNYEFADKPESEDPREKRTNAAYFRTSMVRTDSFIRTRSLSSEEVQSINFVLKSRARKYVAAANEEWLFPERQIEKEWHEINTVLLPRRGDLLGFGGEIYAGFDDGRSYFQDAFGRTSVASDFLERRIQAPKKLGRNDPCGCGSGRKYKHCCLNVSPERRPTWKVLSIRERNLTLFNGITDILGMNAGNSWQDVRRELSDEQVKEIHKLYGYLWPVDTDLISLLPKPDAKLRALYSGVVDPRVTPIFALGLSPLFDELLIAHPFINPAIVKPEFSPVENPHQYKQQTLKNVLLLMNLMPFIDAGFVSLIPDPCDFDQFLRTQMLEMAKSRLQQFDIEEGEEKLLRTLQEEDVKRTLRTLPREYHRAQFSEAMPESSPEEIEKLLDFMEKQTEEDPLALLQEEVISNESGGQLSMFMMSPNFELSLFLAQITGALVLTHSSHRWQEILQSQTSRLGEERSPLKRFVDAASQLEFPISIDPEANYQRRIEFKYGGPRRSMEQLFQMAISDTKNISDAEIESLTERFMAQQQAYIELVNQNDIVDVFKVKLNFKSPLGGFSHKHIQRLLLASDSNTHLEAVPMAILVEAVNSPYGSS